MYDIETASEDFSYLTDKIRIAQEFLTDEAYCDVAFTLGRIFALCQARAKQLGEMHPDQDEDDEDTE